MTHPQKPFEVNDLTQQLTELKKWLPIVDTASRVNDKGLPMPVYEATARAEYLIGQLVLNLAERVAELERRLDEMEAGK